jgi:hypothetical protein
MRDAWRDRGQIMANLHAAPKCCVFAFVRDVTEFYVMLEAAARTRWQISPQPLQALTSSQNLAPYTASI